MPASDWPFTIVLSSSHNFSSPPPLPCVSEILDMWNDPIERTGTTIPTLKSESLGKSTSVFSRWRDWNDRVVKDPYENENMEPWGREKVEMSPRQYRNYHIQSKSAFFSAWASMPQCRHVSIGKKDPEFPTIGLELLTAERRSEILESREMWLTDVWVRGRGLW